jgi:hypothetical protein
VYQVLRYHHHLLYLKTKDWLVSALNGIGSPSGGYSREKQSLLDILHGVPEPSFNTMSQTESTGFVLLKKDRSKSKTKQSAAKAGLVDLLLGNESNENGKASMKAASGNHPSLMDMLMEMPPPPKTPIDSALSPKLSLTDILVPPTAGVVTRIQEANKKKQANEKNALLDILLFNGIHKGGDD